MFKNRKELDEIFKEVEKKTDIFSVQRNGISLYDFMKIDIVFSFIMEVKKEVPIDDNNYANMLYKDNNNKSKGEGVAFFLRGKYNEEGKDPLLDKYIQQESEDNDIYLIIKPFYGYINFDAYKDSGFNVINEYYFQGKNTANKLTEDEELIVLNFFKVLKESVPAEMLVKQENFINRFKFLAEQTSVLYNNLLYYYKSNNIKRVYLIMGYRNLVQVKAARDLGIEVIEIQYANIINDYHIGYPKTYTRPYPNKMYVWDEFYKRNIYGPSEKIVKRPDHLLPDDTEEEDLIVVVAQLGCTEHAIRIVDELLVNETCNIILRLPPGEIGTSTIKRYKKNPQVVVSGQKDVGYITDVLRRSKWVISGFSTALIESYYFGKVPIIDFRIPESEEFQIFVDENKMCEYEPYKKIDTYKNQKPE